MNVTANIDLREFNLAMQQLSKVSKRDFADVCNDNMADLCLTASRYPDKANRADISGMTQKKWWPALIRKVIEGGGYTLKFQKRIPKSEQASRTWIDPVNGRKMFGQKTESEFRKIVKVEKKALRSLFNGRFRGVRDANAARVSASIIRRRLARVGAMRAYLGLAGVRFNPDKMRFKGYGRKNLKGVQTRPASATQAVAKAEALWTFMNNKAPWVNSSAAPTGRPSPAQDVNWKQGVIVKALNRAVPEVTRRLKHAINTKLERMARTYGAQGASIFKGAF